MAFDWRTDPGLDALVPAVITCVDCGGRAHLRTRASIESRDARGRLQNAIEAPTDEISLFE